jgi:pimeloyl-ACP methyl ester carboxylesterase
MTELRIAHLWARLMIEELGYERFAAHGGDIGSGVTQQLALAHPDSLAGIHLTDVPYLTLVTFYGDASELSEAEREYLEEGRKWGQEEGGYAAIQATKPQTLAYGLNDSPAGLAAWIVEKFRSWSDCEGDVDKRFSKDELLTILTIYWATETINSSFRVYYEPLHDPPPATGAGRVEVSTGFAMFPKDIVPAPREWAERFFNVERWTQMPRGGHFAAMEEPELLVENICSFFRSLR